MTPVALHVIAQKKNIHVISPDLPSITFPLIYYSKQVNIKLKPQSKKPVLAFIRCFLYLKAFCFYI